MRNPALDAQKPLDYVTLSDVVEEELEFLWYPYLPAGRVSMIFGEGGIGKSHIICDLCERITNGRPMPFQTDPRIPGRVLLLSAEDDTAVILVPRLRRAGADLTRIVTTRNPLILDRLGVSKIADMIRECAITVVFVDPIVAYMGGKINMNRANEVREFVNSLVEVAKGTGATILLAHHSRKGTEGSDAEKAMGSVDFINAVRSVMYVHEDEEGQKVITHSKHNYSAEGKAMQFRITDTGVEWVRQFIYHATGKSHTSKASSKCIAFLLRALADGPVAAKDLQTLAETDGLSMSTINRVKERVAESYFIKSPEGKLAWWWRLKPE